MNYANIKHVDIADGIGVRVSLFVSGCTHHCKGCFQPETWDFSYGTPFTAQTQDQIIGLLSPGYIRGLTLLGGEPMEPDNQRALLPLLQRVRRELPQKDIWCYSGYTFGELTGESRARCEVTDSVLRLLDVLVDGEFIEEQRSLMLRFRGSANQRILDVPQSLCAGAPVPWKGL